MKKNPLELRKFEVLNRCVDLLLFAHEHEHEEINLLEELVEDLFDIRFKEETEEWSVFDFLVATPDEKAREFLLRNFCLLTSVQAVADSFLSDRKNLLFHLSLICREFKIFSIHLKILSKAEEVGA